MSIDIPTWLENLDTVWDLIDPNGLTTYVLNISLSIVLLFVMSKFSTRRKSQ